MTDVELVRPEFRTLPAPSMESAAFWTGGAEGQLLIHHCDSCGKLFHPPAPACFRCRSTDVGPRPVSGRATVAAFTINRHMWFPGFPPPYVVAYVELVEQPDVRLTTNILGCPVEDVHIGQAVEVRFEHWDDVWIPVFVPAPGGAREPGVSWLDGAAVISGVGQSEVGRRLGRSGIDLTVEACLRAIADAGLTPDDIDGVATYPGSRADAGFSGAGATELHDVLGLRTSWHLGSGEVAGQLGPTFDAAMAVANGLATHVVSFRSVFESSAQLGGSRAATYQSATRADKMREWMAPYGAPSAANWIAPLRPALHVRVRAHPRTARADRADGRGPTRPATRTRSTAQPLDLDDYLVGPDDLRAAVPPRLRRAVPTVRSPSSCRAARRRPGSDRRR